MPSQKVQNFDPDYEQNLGLSTSQGAGTGGGDTSGGGAGGTVTVVGIQGVPVSTTAPTDGQVLTFVAANGDIEWVTPPGGATATKIWHPLMGWDGTHWWVVTDGAGNAIMVFG